MEIEDMTIMERDDLLRKLQREYAVMTNEQKESEHGIDLHERILLIIDSFKGLSDSEIPIRYDMVDMKHYLDCLHRQKNRSLIVSFVDCVFTFAKLIIKRIFCKSK